MTFFKPAMWLGVIGVLLAGGVYGWRRHLDAQLQSRVFRIGYGEDPPFQLRGPDGAPTGVAVEIVKEAARRRGIHLEWLETPHFSEESILHGEADLWVLLTDLPERHGSMYISQPYLTMERCFLVLKGRGIVTARDLEQARIAYRKSWAVPAAGPSAAVPAANADEVYLRKHFPKATPVALPIDREGVLEQALRDGSVDAGLVNKSVLPVRLVAERSRADLDLVNAPDALGRLALGASFDARRAAESIRGEMDRMAEDGTMSRIAEPWGFFDSANLNIVGQLVDTRRTNRLLSEGIGGLAVATVAIGFLTLLVCRQRNAVQGLTARLISAQEQERTRIARDLHDDINQQLAMLAMAMGRMKRASQESAPPPEQWQGLLGQVEQVRTGVHRISHALHPALLELSGLLAALEALRRDLAAASQMTISLEPGPLAGADPVKLPPAIALCFYRVAQEALQNAAKHSGAPEVHIRVSRTGKALELAVSDSGIGISAAAQESRAGLGLLSMQERARLIGGQLRIDSHTDGARRGTTVTVSVPLERLSNPDRTPTLALGGGIAVSEPRTAGE